jgi:four helix bundle protein
MDKFELQDRTKMYALNILRLCARLPKTPEVQVIRRQLIRSGTAVGANYRAACRAKSRRDFIAKQSVVEEEADECRYWLELLVDFGIHDPAIPKLMDESGQLTAIIVASKKTARSRL